MSMGMTLGSPLPVVAAPALDPFALDGTPQAANGTTNALTLPGFSTTYGNVIVYCAIVTNGGPTTSIGGGLTWTKRTSIDQGNPSYTEIWSAKSTSPLSGHVATVNTTTSSFITASIFAFSGADYASPFDPNGAIPQGVLSGAAFTTSNADDILIGMTRQSASTDTAGSGYTLIYSGNFLGVERKLVTATQSGLPLTWGSAIDNNACVDAIKKASSAVYAAQGVNFDGTNDYLSVSALTSIADGKVGTVSFWIKMNGGDGNYQMILDTTSGHFGVFRDNGGVIRVVGSNAAGTSILTIGCSPNVVSGTGWHHILASWDLAANYAEIYLDDVLDNYVVTKTNDTIDYAGSPADYTFGHRATGLLILNADIADFYFNPTASIDLTVTANRRKFLAFSGIIGTPVDLGATGSLPTGTAPIVFLHGTTSTWHTNDGTGGGFTLTGTLTDSSTPPSIAIDTATAAWVNAVVAAGGAVSPPQKSRVDVLIKGLKADGLWTVLDRMYLFAGESDAKQATIDLKALGVATSHGTLPLTAGGYTGDGFTGYLSTTFNPSTAGGNWTQNSAHMGGYVSLSRTTGHDHPILGMKETSANTENVIMPLIAANATLIELNGVSYPSQAETDAKGSWIVSRTSGSGLVLYKNGSSIFTPSSSSHTVGNFPIYIHCENGDGTAGGFSNDRLAAAWWGGGLDATQAGNLASRVNAYLTVWGVSVY